MSGLKTSHSIPYTGSSEPHCQLCWPALHWRSSWGDISSGSNRNIIQWGRIIMAEYSWVGQTRFDSLNEKNKTNIWHYVKVCFYYEHIRLRIKYRLYESFLSFGSSYFDISEFRKKFLYFLLTVWLAGNTAVICSVSTICFRSCNWFLVVDLWVWCVNELIS